MISEGDEIVVLDEVKSLVLCHDGVFGGGLFSLRHPLPQCAENDVCSLLLIISFKGTLIHYVVTVFNNGVPTLAACWFPKESMLVIGNTVPWPVINDSESSFDVQKGRIFRTTVDSAATEKKMVRIPRRLRNHDNINLKIRQGIFVCVQGSSVA
ncbi:hypothetical protein CEXT_765891 [Caerostris extrusa]|uniref:Uncharacterized protein n=1 Tax=Caerostris extrusa TaxID=172846 RepID=A0AAV4X9K6_CAEEX|nr:hypothetical protein CEXT_765891 [Caerostris extrusa]